MTSQKTPRVQPGSVGQVGLAVKIFAWAAGRVAGTEPPNLFLTLGRHRRLFWGWLHFAGMLMPGGRLARRDSEMVILRVAYLRSSAYELAHHRGLARRAGLTQNDIERVFVGPEAEGWSERERAILAAVDSLHHTQDLDDTVWSELRRHLDDRQAIEFCQLVGHYEWLATTIDTLRIQEDRPRS
jgi:alkylhydroperoxidase family enzyme